jgi:hypothetical protein
MKQAIKPTAIRSAVGVLAAIVLFYCAGLQFPVVDATTDTYFREAITKAGVAYATCRVVNATVSVVKASHIQLEPAGIGISLAAGQVLDPIDDMTERLSDVLVTAITSLGVQKLAHDIFVSLAPPVLAVFVLALSILVWFSTARIAHLKTITVKIVIVIAIARICLPLSSVANGFIYTHFFADQVEAANAQLSLVSAEFDKLNDFSLPAVDGLMKTIENSAALLKQKTSEFTAAIETLVANMGETIENLLRLTFIFVAVFLIQVVMLPLLTFWFLVNVTHALFQYNAPLRRDHPPTTTARKEAFDSA